MNRTTALERLRSVDPWDVVVIGGGATGLGVAVDAASRGYRTALLEQGDFAQATSSRSTKLLHGGVRYLRSGEIGLVRSALRERGLLERNAPHLVSRQPFVIPAYGTVDRYFYGAGLKMYEWLSGSLSFGASRLLSVADTIRLLPTVRRDGLRGGVLYYDGQFDDARLAVALAQTASDHGAAVVNYLRVDRLLKKDGRLRGVAATDIETGVGFELTARVVVNATGIFADEIRHLDEPGSAPLLTYSSGVHLVLDQSRLPGGCALMIPKTQDGRVLFAVPWLGKIILGTTDEIRPAPEMEPRPLPREIDFLLEHATAYLDRPLDRNEVRSVFVGFRPLMRRVGVTSAGLSRDHVLITHPSGLVTITGGKWTTYRKMAEDAVDQAARVGGLPHKTSLTTGLRLHGAPAVGEAVATGEAVAYGTDVSGINQLATMNPALATPLHPRLPFNAAQVVWAAQHEMARSVEDVLARRTRALFLDARAALEAAPTVAALLAREFNRGPEWSAAQVDAFAARAQGYMLVPVGLSENDREQDSHGPAHRCSGGSAFYPPIFM